MSVLHRELPTPSDRMGILWSIMPIHQCVVLEYGPSGTTHFSITTSGRMEAEAKDRLFCTHLTQQDVIMGSTKHLEEAILEIDRTKKPKYIFIVGSSVTSIIAADLQGVIYMMQDQVQAKLICFEHGGFRGDYALGIRDALKALSIMVKPPQKKDNNKFNIIGAVGDSYRNSSDIVALCDVMERAFGMEPLAIIPQTASATIEQSSEAAINLVVRNEGLALAKIMETEFGIPYLYGCPYGYQGTKKWLTQIGEKMDRLPDRDLIEYLDEQSAECHQYKMYQMMRKIPLKAKIFANYDVSLGIGDFLREELFFEEVDQYVSHSLKHIEACKENVIPMTHEGEKIQCAQDIRDTFVLGDDCLLKMVDSSNTTIRVAHPIFEWTTIARHMPFMTDKGADYIREYVEAYLRSMLRNKND